jgi:hypothetical protein
MITGTVIFDLYYFQEINWKWNWYFLNFFECFLKFKLFEDEFFCETIQKNAFPSEMVEK